jgi:hypothetical protein
MELLQLIVDGIFALHNAFGVLDIPLIGSIFVAILDALCPLSGVVC